jgi:NADPH:quinone reductase-like Zn-dependent oxidoreductase
MSQTQLAIVVGSDITSYSLKSIDVPKPEADEILVKIHAAAQNPTDCETNAVKYRYFQALTDRFNREDCRMEFLE